VGKLYDLVLTNGSVVDGSGLPAYRADIGVRDGVIQKIGTIDPSDADEVVDAQNLTVAPGFIDPHTHLDPQLCWDPLGLPSVLHGVTTVMTGNCSVTVAPCRPEHRDALSRLFVSVEEVPLAAFEQAVSFEWETFGEYLDVLDRHLGINVAAMVGHSALRYYVMGPASFERHATPAEIDEMREVLRQALRDGAAGFSTSRLMYHQTHDGRSIPSRMASDTELLALAQVLGEEGLGLFETDGGDDTHHYPEHIDNLAGPIALETRRPVLIGGTMSEDKAPDVWRRTHETIAKFQAAGARIFTQASPCRLDVTFAMTTTTAFQDMPTWHKVFALEADEKLQAYQDPAVRDAMQFESVEDTSPIFFSRDWTRVVVARTGHERNRDLVGRSIQEIASAQGKRIIDALLDIVVDEKLDAEFLLIGCSNGDDADVATMLRSSQAIVGASDAGAHVKTLCGAGDTSLLLSKWTRDKHVFSLEEAVRAMTFVPASVIGLQRRGMLATGYFADIVVFDPEKVEYLKARTVTDVPGGGSRLWRDAVGVRDVIVNGQIVVRDGAITGALPGRVLRSTQGVASAPMAPVA
jgi:N-acyl-D-amino-acid deacylase